MAARKVRKNLDSEWRERIQAGNLLNRLMKNAMSEEEIMTTGQIRSAEILLKKVIPDLSATDLYVKGRLKLDRKVTRLDGSVVQEDD